MRTKQASVSDDDERVFVKEQKGSDGSDTLENLAAEKQAAIEQDVSIAG